MSITEELVRNVLEPRYDTFSKEDVDHAKNRIIDVVGCLVAGVNYPGCSMIRDLVVESGGKKESTILVHGDRVPADAF